MANYLKNKLRGLIFRKSYKFFPKSKSIIISPDLIMGNYLNINIEPANVSINIGTNVIFKEFCSLVVNGSGSLSINANVFFNNYCSINCLGEIKIGTNTLFGEGVKIYDHNHKYETSPEIKVHAHQFTISPVTIGKNCWIGSNVTILKGVDIGDNVIIGANSLIHKSIPANSIVKANSPINIQSL
jgi:acetyltransferase-like isoleucine patch superfamily enzyme